MKYILGLGSNLGNKSQNLNDAIFQLGQKVGIVLEVSSFHKSKPHGFSSENNFLNCCLLIESQLIPVKLLGVIKNIEKNMGRQYMKEGYEDRIIDIDIILSENKFSSKMLNIPHKNYLNRDFVLFPLSELTDFQDLNTFMKISQLLK
ncbi:MAG: 2-amino-4-hydroxy-6-hydroxymethyldihydropteridine diphosphokinase [Bacteroidetes bacterium]|nr:2-amino-4-hydroxy-6-hydroxymethyldihydropteridine diphosphokinase [Bacteroidota bacterium]